MKPTIAIGTDHAGFTQKEMLLTFLKEEGYHFHDFGTHSEESVDYPDFAHAVANAIEKKEYEIGILLCGSGNGVVIAANKHTNVRAALCWNIEIAELAKKHNNANIICLPSRFISNRKARKIIKAFLTTEFEGGRHEKRVEKIEK